CSTVWSIAVGQGPGNPIFAGTGDGSTCAGVYRSLDGGISWVKLGSGLAALTEVTALVFNAAGDLYLGAAAGSLGVWTIPAAQLGAPNPTWTAVNTGLTTTSVSALAA